MLTKIRIPYNKSLEARRAEKPAHDVDLIQIQGSSDRSEFDIQEHIASLNTQMKTLRQQEGEAQADLATALHASQPTTKASARLREIRDSIEVLELTIAGLEADAVIAHGRELWAQYEAQVTAQAAQIRDNLTLWAQLESLMQTVENQTAAYVSRSASIASLRQRLEKPKYGYHKRDFTAVLDEAGLPELYTELAAVESAYKNRRRVNGG